MKINYCGDSFCASDKHFAWTKQLASKLNAEIVGLGRNGMAHEFAIQSFNEEADINVFCWTEAHRLFYKDYALNFSTVFSPASDKHFKEDMRASKNPILGSAYYFFKYLHDIKYFEQRQMRDLYWFDKEILSNYRGVAVHCFCFQNTYSFENGLTYDTLLNEDRSFKAQGGEIENHKNELQNTRLANNLFCLIDNIL